MEKENFGKCCQNPKWYDREITASRLPCTGRRQYICQLKDVRALEFCLNFYNRDPKTIDFIAKNGGWILCSRLTPDTGHQFIWSATMPAWHSLDSPQVCIHAKWNWSHFAFLFCFKQTTASCPVQNETQPSFHPRSLVWLSQYMVKPKLINIIACVHIARVHIALVIGEMFATTAGTSPGCSSLNHTAHQSTNSWIRLCEFRTLLDDLAPMKHWAI